ncbi:hypothetical protein [Rhodococcus sp. NPDC127528]|uniref:hypothetical protein n=1 Tax=unclassified Rhodococcus (in: high G+C Gram-positive bacteria) TaxID=192944 RepID=UPI003640BDFE
MTVEQTDNGNSEGQAALIGEKRCFIVCPIGPDGSDVRKRSNQIKTHIIDEALRHHSYTSVRADAIDKSGNISNQIVTELIEADLVIADLTGHNPNVFYELAIRHSFAKPYIQLMQVGQDIPFDVINYRTIFVDHQDLDSAASARQQIIDMIGQIERDQREGKAVDTPVGQAVNLQTLGQSSDPEQREIAQLSKSVDAMRVDLQQVVRGTRFTRPSFGDEQIQAMRKTLLELASGGQLGPWDMTALEQAPRTKSYDAFLAAINDAMQKRVHTSNDEPPF